MSPPWLASLLGARRGPGRRAGRASGGPDPASAPRASSSRHVGSCSSRRLRARRGRMGDPSRSCSSSSARRSFPRPRARHRTAPPRPRLPVARTLSPRPCGPRKRGRASARSGQWELSLEAGAWRSRRDAPSGGCFKMADVAGPSRPGAAAFWSRDCILRPAGRGRRRLPPCDEGRAVAWDSGGTREARCGPRAETCRPAPV